MVFIFFSLKEVHLSLYFFRPRLFPMHLQKCRESREQNTDEPNHKSPKKRKIEEDEYSSPKRRREYEDEDQDEKRVPPVEVKIPRDQGLENTGSSPTKTSSSSPQDDVTTDKVANSFFLKIFGRPIV